MKRLYNIFLIVTVYFQAMALKAETVATITSPNKNLVVHILINGEGRPGYNVESNGKNLVSESRLGFLLSDAPQLARNFIFVNAVERSEDGTWKQPWGEWESIRNHFNELKVRIQEKTPLHRQLDIVFRVYDDGIGFRYEFPEQPTLKIANIVEELTQFNLAEPATAWWIPAIESNREEYLYNKTSIDEVGLAQTPMTVKLSSGSYISFHEAALVNYSAMNIQKVEGRHLKAVLTPSSSGPKVTRALPFVTPWRTLTIASDAPGLYMSHLILNLNEPNKLGDVSWVHPRKYVGIWWGMHLDTQSWASGVKHGATTAYAKKMINFASKNGFSGLLVEGWNQGWDGDWFANGDDFSFTKAYPDYDLDAVVAYGKTKNVSIIAHNETSANAAHYEAEMGAAFDLYKSLGIDTIKTGYVSDAGGFRVRKPDGSIVFDWHEGQASSVHHLKVVTEAAKRHIAINPHEPIKDTGLRRTYPNWISREGARGMEYNAWGVPKNPPAHEANLVFTRMLSGPFDSTPGVLSLKGRDNSDILSTEAKQLALYVVIYSPIQMVPDLPENYENHLPALQFIKDVPTDWSDTRVLAGEIGDHAVIARKDRASDNWYLGAVGNDQSHMLTVKLDFLSAHTTYLAQIYRDGSKADYRTEAKHSMIIESRKVHAGDKLTLPIAPGGGEAIRFVAQ